MISDIKDKTSQLAFSMSASSLKSKSTSSQSDSFSKDQSSNAKQSSDKQLSNKQPKQLKLQSKKLQSSITTEPCSPDTLIKIPEIKKTHLTTKLAMVSDSKLTSFAFRKAQRLLTPNDYKKVFDNIGLKIHGEYLLFMVRKYSNQEPITNNTNRLGLAISKAKVKHAHERNRIKRLIREHFRLKQEKISFETNERFEIVALVKKSPATLTNKALNSELDMMFNKLAYKLKKKSQKS